MRTALNALRGRARLVAPVLAGPRPSLLLDMMQGVLDPRVQFSRASNATRIGPDGRLELVAANTPRFDYSPTSIAGTVGDNTVTNGGFQGPTGWTQIQGGGLSLSGGVATVTSNSANYGAIQQTINGLTPGKRYQLRFTARRISAALPALGILAQHEGQWFANAPHAYQELGTLYGADGMPILALDGQPTGMPTCGSPALACLSTLRRCWLPARARSWPRPLSHRTSSGSSWWTLQPGKPPGPHSRQ